MPDTVFINVPPNFNLHMFAGQLAEKYRMEGFTVTVADFNNTVVITFDKNTGGINMLLGLGEGIKATCMVANGVLSINFSDGDWTGKIIGLVVGWFICLIPFITAIIGCVKQSQLPKNIGNDAVIFASQQVPPENFNTPYESPYNDSYQPDQPDNSQQQPPNDDFNQQ